MKTKTKLMSLLALVLLVGSINGSFAVHSVNAVFSPNTYVIDDSPYDAFASENEMTSMIVTANATHLIVSVVGDIANSGAMLFIDTDPGNGTGFTDMTNAGWYRNVQLGSGFGAEYWAAGWQQDYGTLWDATPAVIDDGGTNDLVGYGFHYATGVKTYEFAFSMLYSSVPATINVGIAAVVVGGGSWGPLDTIPSQAGLPVAQESDVGVVNQWIDVKLDSATGLLDSTPVTIGYLAHETDNLVNGSLTAGNALQMTFNVWMHDNASNTVHDVGNTSAAVLFDYIIERSGVNTTYHDFAYKDFGGRVGLGSDKHDVFIPATTFQTDDIVYWSVSSPIADNDAGYGTISGMFTVAPLPPVHVAYVGSVTPTGGFIAPGADVVVAAQANWLFTSTNDTTDGLNADPTANLPVVMTVYYRGNNTGVFTGMNMSWEKFENNNNNYEATLGSFSGGNVTFYVKGWTYHPNNNTLFSAMMTGNYTVLIGVEPPRASFYQIDDAADDLSLLLPAGPADPWGAAGLIDITSFEVLYNEYNVEFRLTFNNLTNGFNSPAGFSVVIFSIYIDTAAGGETATLWNEQVTTFTGWEFAMKADGFVPQFFTSGDTTNPVQGSGMQMIGNTTSNQASIVIPVSQLGTPQNDWKFYVMAGSDDFNSYRAAGAAHGGDWQLGGGIEGEIDPNVVDMLVPTGASADLQDFLLSRYDVPSSTLAQVLAVGKTETFVADTVAPTASVNVKYDGATVANDSTITLTTGTTADVTVSVTLTDGATSVLSGLKSASLYDGNVLVATVDLSGLTATHDFTASLDVGTHKLTLNVYDTTGNVRTVTFTVTVKGTTPSSSSSNPSPLPVGFMPVLLALSAVAALTFRRRKN